MIYDVNSALFPSFLSQKGGPASEKKELSMDSRKNENDCLQAVKEEIPTVTINSAIVTERIAFFKSRALICRFRGPRPKAAIIENWALKHWSTKEEFTISYYSNGYLLVVFASEEDRDEIFQGGPWFLGWAGLFMKLWHTNFRPQELPSQYPVLKNR